MKKKLGRKLISLILVAAVSYSCSCSSCGNSGEVPNEIFLKTDLYLKEKVGEDFFENYIYPNYEGSKKKNDLYEVRYFFVMLEYDFVHEDILIITDNKGNVSYKYPSSGIPTCVSEPNGCKFNVDKNNALQIAEDFGLPAGVKEWAIEFRWGDEIDKYIWHIISTTKELGSEESYKVDGEELMIDPVTGKVLKHREWKIR